MKWRLDQYENLEELTQNYSIDISFTSNELNKFNMHEHYRQLSEKLNKKDVLSYKLLQLGLIAKLIEDSERGVIKNEDNRDKRV